MEISVKDIKTDYNPRTNFENIDKLAASIKEIGLLQPLVVSKNNGHYILHDGARRLCALKKLKIETVDVVVRELDCAQQKEIPLITDFFKDKLKLGEKAVGIASLIDKKKEHTPQSLSKKYGISVQLINKMLKVAKLDTEVVEHLNTGRIDFDTALDLTHIKNVEKQRQFAGLLAEKKFHDLEALLFNSGLVFPLEFDDVFTYEEAKKDGQVGLVYKDEFDGEIVFCYDKEYYEQNIT